MSTDSKSTVPDPLARLEAWLRDGVDGRAHNADMGRAWGGGFSVTMTAGCVAKTTRVAPTLAAAITAALDAVEVDRG